MRKALVVRLPPEGDMGDLVQIARAEGKKLFHGGTIKVVETLRTGNPDEWVAVIQNSDSGSEGRIRTRHHI